jgi:hypothetical protein
MLARLGLVAKRSDYALQNLTCRRITQTNEHHDNRTLVGSGSLHTMGRLGNTPRAKKRRSHDIFLWVEDEDRPKAAPCLLLGENGGVLVLGNRLGCHIGSDRNRPR